MKYKNKKLFGLFLFAGCVLLSYWLWLSMRPVEIVAIHQENNYSDILVNNFPFTDKGKIDWWLKNKDMFKEKYGIPKPDSDGYFTVSFWGFGDGYVETDGYDRLCFSDMEPPLNCINKNSLMFVKNGKNTGMSFWVDGGIYRVKENGKMVKSDYD